MRHNYGRVLARARGCSPLYMFHRNVVTFTSSPLRAASGVGLEPHVAYLIVLWQRPPPKIYALEYHSLDVARRGGVYFRSKAHTTHEERRTSSTRLLSSTFLRALGDLAGCELEREAHTVPLLLYAC